jgi:hypothetical protein
MTLPQLPYRNAGAQSGVILMMMKPKEFVPVSSKKKALSLMSPPTRRDLPRLGQLDHMHWRLVAALDRHFRAASSFHNRRVLNGNQVSRVPARGRSPARSSEPGPPQYVHRAPEQRPALEPKDCRLSELGEPLRSLPPCLQERTAPPGA